MSQHVSHRRSDEVHELHAEIERLRAGRDAYKSVAVERAADITSMKDRIDSRLNDYLVEMKPGYDDSITGFNEAWDIVRKFFAELEQKP